MQACGPHVARLWDKDQHTAFRGRRPINNLARISLVWDGHPNEMLNITRLDDAFFRRQMDMVWKRGYIDTIHVLATIELEDVHPMSDTDSPVVWVYWQEMKD